MTRLLWTSDACLTVSILGWVTLAVGYGLGLYLWYMTLCFWKLLRAARRSIACAASRARSPRCPSYATATRRGATRRCSPGGGEGEGGEGDGVRVRRQRVVRDLPLRL